MYRGVPSATKPPFACMRLCNPWIESSKKRGFTAASPGIPLEKCAPKQIYVDRKTGNRKKSNKDDTVYEAQILLEAANDVRTLGQQWHEYKLAKKDFDHLSIGVKNDDLIKSVQALKDDYLTCKRWMNGK